MLGIGHPDRHALPRITLSKTHQPCRAPPPARAGSFLDPKQTLAVGDSNRQIVWISDISRRRCYSAMIMLGSDNQGLEALWVRAA